MDVALMFFINKILPMAESKYVINVILGRSNSTVPAQTDNTPDYYSSFLLPSRMFDKPVFEG